MENSFCAPEFHTLEYVNTHWGETLYQCTVCPYFEFQYKDCDGV